MSAKKRRAGPVYGVRVEVQPGATPYLARVLAWIIVDGREIPWCPPPKILNRASKARSGQGEPGHMVRYMKTYEVDFLTPRFTKVDHPDAQAQLAHATSYLETLPVRRPNVFARDPSVLEALARDLGDL